MIVESNSESTGPEKGRPEVIIVSEELIVEIIVQFEDFDDILEFALFPIFRSILTPAEFNKLALFFISSLLHSRSRAIQNNLDF